MKVDGGALVAILSMLVLAQPAAARPQGLVDQFERRSLTYEGMTLPYCLSVPVDYGYWVAPGHGHAPFR